MHMWVVYDTTEYDTTEYVTNETTEYGAIRSDTSFPRTDCYSHTPSRLDLSHLSPGTDL